MTEPGRRWSLRFRVVLIVLMLAVGIAVTMVSTILVAEVDRSSSPGSITRWVLSAALALFSGIYVNLVLAAIVRVWRRPEAPDTTVNAVIDTARRWLRRKRKWAAIVLTVAAIVAVGVALRPPQVGLEPGGLVLMTAFNESEENPRTILVKQWNQTHPANPVRIEFVPGEPDQQNAQMADDARPGGPNEADVYVLDLVWMPQFAEAGYIRELSRADLPELADFLPKVLATCTHDEKLWGLPLNTDAGLLYYRTGAVVPEDWDDYFGREAGAAALAAGVEAANAAQLADEEILTITALEAMWAADGKTFGADGQVARGDRGAVQFGSNDLVGLRNLVEASRNPDVVLDEVRSTTDDQAVRAFIEGRATYMRNWPVVRDRLADKAEIGFDVAATPTPSVLGGQNVAISASTGKPRAAQALIEFLTGSASQMILSEVGGFAPTRQSAYDNASRKDIAEVRASVDDARLRPTTRNYVEFSRALREGITAMLDAGPNAQLPPDLPARLGEILDR